MGVYLKISDDTMISIMKEFYHKNNRIPSANEWRKEKIFPFSECTIRNRFGSIEKAWIKAIGYYPNLRKKNKPRKTIKCSECGKSTIKDAYSLRKYERLFCSHTCRAIFYNKDGTLQSGRVSKLEKWLQGNLLIIYPNLKFDFNKKDAIGSELDIYVPELKLAFEINGIFHYEPIYGKDKLNKIQKNDSNKFMECQKNNIGLYIINCSLLKKSIPKNMKKYLDIILDIINKEITSQGFEP